MNTYKAVRWGLMSFSHKFPVVQINKEYLDILSYKTFSDSNIVSTGHLFISLTEEHIMIKHYDKLRRHRYRYNNEFPQFFIVLEPKDNELFLQDLRDLQDICFILNFEDETDCENITKCDKLIRI
jgi:hypothetical protein